jgi:hypothetical protein
MVLDQGGQTLSLVVQASNLIRGVDSVRAEQAALAPLAAPDYLVEQRIHVLGLDDSEFMPLSS